MTLEEISSMLSQAESVEKRVDEVEETVEEAKKNDRLPTPLCNSRMSSYRLKSQSGSGLSKPAQAKEDLAMGMGGNSLGLP